MFQAKLEVQCREHASSANRQCDACRAAQRLEAEYTALFDQRRRFLANVSAVLTEFRDKLYITNLK